MRAPRTSVQPRATVSALVALALVLGGCADRADDGSSVAASDSTIAPVASVLLPEPVQELDIDATEYTFKLSPDPSVGLKPGWTLLKFHNVGVEPHQVMFARLKDGVDPAKLAAAGANDSSGASAIAFVDMIGGVSYIGAGQDTTALVNLTEGTVLAMCYVPDANGVAHALMGMTSALKVSASVGGAPATRPEQNSEEVVGTIELAADGYRIPDKPGAGWYHVKNTDSALHELALLRLGASISDDEVAELVEDLAANKATQVTLDAVGGMGAISAGFDGYLYLDLDPGDYLAVDFMPDAGAPRPHMLDGYYGRFTV